MLRLLPLSTRRIVAAAALSCVLAALVSAAACSFLIADNLPPFTCLLGQKDFCPNGQVCASVGAGPTGMCLAPCVGASCPSGYRCDTNSRLCAPVTDGAMSETGTSDGNATSDGTTEAYVDAYADTHADADASAAIDSRSADVLAESAPTGDAEAGAGNADGCAGGAIGCECSTLGTTTACEVGAFCVDWQAITGANANDAGAGDAEGVDGGAGDGGAGDAEAGAGGGARVCTKACCTSNDCDRGSACFATGAGGNYCVPAAVLTDRAATGTLNGNGGQPCDAGGSCRSGLCSPLSGFCVDTCCTSAQPMGRMGAPQCAAMTSCRVGTFQGGGYDMNYVPRCAPAMGNAGNGDPCVSNSECRSNLCVNDPTTQNLTCRDPCRRPEDCNGMFQQPPQTCQYLQLSSTGSNASSDLVAACGPLSPSGPAGSVLDSRPCKVSSDCARGYCAQTGAGQSVCISVCFIDGDCISNEVCRPQILQVAGTAYSVLACK